MQQNEQILAVRQMQSYIDAHIHEPITLYQLAQIAKYSPTHCAHLFKQYTGKAPFEYIRSMRLSKAALRLRDERSRVVDVAFDFVFDSHEGFTRAFSRAFGISPYRYRKQTPPIPLFMPFQAHGPVQELKGGFKMPEKVQTVFVQVIERPERKLLLRRGKKASEYFSYCEEVGCDVYALLSSVKEAMYEPVGLWLPEKLIPTGTSKYVQGVELPMDYCNAVPQKYDLITLPPCKMMVFQGEPFEDDDFMEAIAVVEKVIDSYNPEPYGFEWADEDAPRFQLAPLGYRGYMEARPVRPLERR